MAQITAEFYHECYSLGKKIMTEGLEIEAAVHKLYNIGMKPESARPYLRSVRAMLTGERFTSTINNVALSYFLTQIYSEYKADGLRKALKSVNQYLDYQKDKNHLPGTKKIYEDFMEFL